MVVVGGFQLSGEIGLTAMVVAIGCEPLIG